MNRWRGLKDLVYDAVEHGSVAVEHVHQEVAGKPFDVLERMPPLMAHAHAARLMQEILIGGAYRTIRVVNSIVAGLAGIAIDVVEASHQRSGRSRAENEVKRRRSSRAASAPPGIPRARHGRKR